MEKSETAFRTIGELSSELGVPQHILRYWETRFPQLRPLQRAGNRRYYRPADVALARRIHQLLNQDGYTIKGVQKLLGRRGVKAGAAEPDATVEDRSDDAAPTGETTRAASEGELPLFAPAPAAPAVIDELEAIRDTLAAALTRDRG